MITFMSVADLRDGWENKINIPKSNIGYYLFLTNSFDDFVRTDFEHSRRKKREGQRRVNKLCQPNI